MFPLRTRTFPATAVDLEHLLNKCLRELVTARRDPVRVIDASFPALKEIVINLDGAEIRPSPPKPRPAKGENAPALTVEKFSLSGSGVLIGPASVNLVLDARGVDVDRDLDTEGEILLSLERAANGQVKVSTATSDLEALIGEVAKREAGKHGVAIEDVRLTLRQLGPRALEIEVNLRARKMIFTASVRIAGRVEIDAELNVTAANLQCRGEGAIGSLACGLLSPHLDKLEGRSFALMALSLGEVRLRDIRLSVDDEVSATAQFGA